MNDPFCAAGDASAITVPAMGNVEKLDAFPLTGVLETVEAVEELSEE